MAGEQDESTPEEGEDLSQLELPSLFRRRKRGQDAGTGEDAEPAAPEPESVETRAPAEPAAEEAPAAAPSEPAEPPTRRFSLRRRRRADDTEQVSTSSTSESSDVQVTETTDAEPPETTAPPEVEPPETTEDATAAKEVEPVDTTPEDDPEPPTAVWEPSGQPAEPAPEAAPAEEKPEAAASEADVPKGPSLLERLADVRLPPVAGQVAAAVTGAVVGLVGVGLVLASESGCAAVRGTTSCGNAGLFLVIAIMALAVVLGAVGLRAWGQSDALSTSFLGVGLVVVLVMLLLLPVVDRWFMVVVLPLLGAGSFALSWWVSNRMGPEARRLNDEYSPERHR